MNHCYDGTPSFFLQMLFVHSLIHKSMYFDPVQFLFLNQFPIYASLSFSSAFFRTLCIYWTFGIIFVDLSSIINNGKTA